MKIEAISFKHYTKNTLLRVLAYLVRENKISLRELNTLLYEDIKRDRKNESCIQLELTNSDVCNNLLLAQSFLKRDREIELSTVTDDEYESNKELLIKINNRFDDYCFNSFSELKKYLLEINKITLID